MINKSTGKYKALIIIQMLFIILGLTSTIYEIFISKTSNVIATPYLYFVAYICIIVYALWGFKHSIIPYNIAITIIIVAETLSLDRAFRIGASFLMVVLSFTIIIMMIVFQNTFKKYKVAASVSGSIAVLASLVKIISFIVHIEGFDEIKSAMPMSTFLIVSTLFITYYIRCKWSEEGKKEIFMI